MRMMGCRWALFGLLALTLVSCAPRTCPCPSLEEAPPSEETAVRGMPTAFVEIEEFSDFECPYCGRVQRTLHELHARYAGQIRHVFRHLPLAFHAHALDAARAAVAAERQGKFWPYHDRLFASSEPLTMAVLLQEAEALGIDREQFEQDFSSERTRERIRADIALSEERGVRGVPYFLLNGRKLVGAVGIELFEAIVDEEIAKGEALLAEGVPPEEIVRILTERNLVR